MLKLTNSIYYEGNEECAIIVDTSQGKFFELNVISHEIVQLIKQNKTEEKIIEYIVSKYNVEIERASIDVKMFIQKLIDLGIVEFSEKIDNEKE